MNTTIIKSQTKKAFTIVELLTVMSIIVILIGLLVPAMNKAKEFSYEVKQKTQLKSIGTALEFFNSQMDGYPDSTALDPTSKPYCGAMKLAEAMMGQDLRGFHPDSIFRVDGTDGLGKILYPDANNVTQQAYDASLNIRKGPYLPLENANAFLLRDLYANTGILPANRFVLCDVFKNVTNRATGKKIGMPILYYKADNAKNHHNINDPDDSDNIYNYKDNSALVGLGMPFASNKAHSLNDGRRFYLNTKNDKVTTASIPYQESTYILISAGNDGEYGTPDDICNFEWKYTE
jgi:type II secretory pathway pseudopilin PulG